jgi:preprotein translocase subunit YajC
MFISPAYAQTAGADGPGLIATLIPFLLIFLIMWLLIIRPQQKKLKEHRAMVEALRRGDQIVTAGGIVGKVTKVREDGEVEVEIAPNVSVRVLKSTVSTVLSKTEPAVK